MILGFVKEVAERTVMHPSHPESLIGLGITQARLGRLNEALDHFQQAVAARPDFAPAHHNLGVALAQQGRLVEVCRTKFWSHPFPN